MKKLLGTIIILYLLFLNISYVYAASSNTQTFFKAQVKKVLDEKNQETGGIKSIIQTVEVKILDGSELGKSLQVTYGGLSRVTPQQKLIPGDTVVLLRSVNGNNTITYSIVDKYRLDSILYIALGFFLLVITVAGTKGIGSIIGMGISLLVILKFIVPSIIAGGDPLMISIIGAIVIMITSIYLAHGFSKQTSIAIVATAISLIVTGLLSISFVQMAHLSGLGNEDATMLQFGTIAINLQGLLLGGIIIGTLGVLDDTTTTQAATIFELHKTNTKLTFEQLLKKGFSIGTEHIASLVNTLVLAYAGASLVLFIIFVINPTHQPYWVILNSEIITEEVIRTLCGSIGLVLAVPITTVIAAFSCKYTIHFS